MGGILILFSATYYQALHKGDALLEVKRQLIGIGLGAVAMLVTSRIPYRFWRQTWVVAAGLILLFMCIPGWAWAAMAGAALICAGWALIGTCRR